MFFTSAPDALWLTLVELSGNSPITAYTFPGRIVTLFQIFSTVWIVTIPMGLLAAAFQDWADTNLMEEEDDTISIQEKMTAPSARYKHNRFKAQREKQLKQEEILSDIKIMAPAEANGEAAAVTQIDVTVVPPAEVGTFSEEERSRQVRSHVTIQFNAQSFLLSMLPSACSPTF